MNIKRFKVGSLNLPESGLYQRLERLIGCKPSEAFAVIAFVLAIIFLSAEVEPKTPASIEAFVRLCGMLLTIPIIIINLKKGTWL